MKVVNLRNGAVLADKVKMANSALSRLIGLLNRKNLQEGEGLILKPSNSIHTCFMRFSIDVLFVDKNNQIIAVSSSMKPFRLSRVYFRSFLVVELPAGIIEKTGTRPGDSLEIKNEIRYRR